MAHRIEALMRTGPGPVIVALDGRSGAGKSTLAAAVGAHTRGLVIDGDDFYRGGTDEYWDVMDAWQKMDLVIDWRRQRAALERLRRGAAATWRPYDWDPDDGSLAADVTGGPSDVVILDGATARAPSWPTRSACVPCCRSHAWSAVNGSCSAKVRTTGRSGRPGGAPPRTCTSTR
jgi:hypothetical protein